MIKTIYLHVALIFSLSLLGQEEIGFYKVEENKICFEFDIRNMEKMVGDQSSKIHDFKDFDIRELINTGAYTSWEQKGWTIRMVNRFVFQIVKSLDKFDESIDYGNKFMIQEHYWKSPLSYKLDYVSSKIVKINPKGNKVFYLKGHKRSKNVILTGSFINWDESALKMEKSEDGWKLIMDIPPGIYEYKFIVDGNWTHDTANNSNVKNEHGTLNSILLIGKSELFFLNGHPLAKEVILAGSFNNWNEKILKLDKVNDGWAISTPLPPGKHFYKFKVDGKWIVDENNDLSEYDERGYLNSVRLIDM